MRVSGPQAFDLARALCGRLPLPRQASLRALRSADGMLLDRALVLRFDASGSATGEDLVEFHCHGGCAVVAAVEQALLANAGARAALPGEFTRRALENGRIDLAQARGLADLLEAETETQRRYAVAASDGHLSRMVNGWIDRLVELAADVEAAIEYGEEGDVQLLAPSMGRIVSETAKLKDELTALLSVPPVERWRDGIRVVLAGPPNAGKSTLLNLLAGREAAIVSPIAGTTRDQIDVPVQREGVAYVISDTAGLWDGSANPIEQLGMKKARVALAGADLLLWLGDGDAPVENAVRIHARADVPGREVAPVGTIATSACNRATIDGLWEVISNRTASASLGDIALHRVELDQCRRCVEALAVVIEFEDEAVIAEGLRAAVGSLASITGHHATELMLDRLFSRFCVGK